jgi:dTDP-4-dehydrorhamnose reductase
MSQLRILITGAGGQLGTDLAQLCLAAGDAVLAPPRADLDVTDADAIHQAIQGWQPDAVVNCGAWTAVDDCESDVERAMAINGHAVGMLGEAASDAGAHFVQVSTDYVFDGNKVDAYVVDDATNPQSVYGKSKVLGEQLTDDAAAIVRTSWVCSAHGGNMVATILRLAGAHPTLRFVADQRGRPTFTTDLAASLRNLAAGRVGGRFHVANHGEVSWFEFAQAVLSEAGHDPERVLPIASADLDPPRPAPRPANSVLDTSAYEGLGFGQLRHFSEPLAEVVPQYGAS